MAKMGRPRIRDEAYKKEYQRAYYLKNKGNWAKYRKDALVEREGTELSLFQDAEAERRKAYHRERRDRVIEYLGGSCVRCGFADSRALQIDHVHGGGVRELNAKGFSYPSYMKKILSEAPGVTYQLLCANCNWIKRSENGEHSQLKKRTS